MNRIESVDVIRLIAITAVIVLHTQPFSSDVWTGIYADLRVLLDQLARFAVPFFFVVSGFFWGGKVRSGAAIMSTYANMIKRLFAITFFWSLLYFLLDTNFVGVNESHGVMAVLLERVKGLMAQPEVMLFEGGNVHLWFLIALAYSLTIVSILTYFRSPDSILVFVAFVLYVFGVLAKSYSETIVGIDFDFNTRNGPFFGTLFFVSGYMLSKYTPALSWLKSGFGLLAAGYVLHFLEIFWLKESFGVAMYSHDYVFGTSLCGVGAAMMALSGHPLLNSTRLSVVGRYTLGIYAIHYLFVVMLSPIGRLLNSPYWEIANIFVVLLVSIGVVKLMVRSKSLRYLVS